MNYRITVTAAQLEILSMALAELKARREVVETVNAISQQVQKQNEEMQAEGLKALMETQRALRPPASKPRKPKLNAVAAA